MNEAFEKLGFVKTSPAAADTLAFNPFDKIGKQWFLVTAGDESGWNTMTASWGFAGVVWGKNAFTTVVRPQRYTKEFIDRTQYFTISFFGEQMKKALSFCGSHSGRDCDKAAETGLIPMFIKDESNAYGEDYKYSVAAFEQAELILVCKKAYVQKMQSECFCGGSNDEKCYPDKDYHYQYIGEICAMYVKQR